MFHGNLNGNSGLLYLGLGLPIWFYLLYYYMKWFNKIEVDKESFIVRNVFFGKRTILFKEIEEWEEIETVRIFQRNLLIRINGKKTIISNLSDIANYEILKSELKTNWSETERKYL